MFGEQFAGICRKYIGRLNQARGVMTGDPLRAAAGRRAWILEMAQQERIAARKESERQLKDFQRCNRNWYPGSAIEIV